MPASQPDQQLFLCAQARLGMATQKFLPTAELAATSQRITPFSVRLVQRPGSQAQSGKHGPGLLGGRRVCSSVQFLVRFGTLWLTFRWSPPHLILQLRRFFIPPGSAAARGSDGPRRAGYPINGRWLVNKPSAAAMPSTLRHQRHPHPPGLRRAWEFGARKFICLCHGQPVRRCRLAGRDLQDRLPIIAAMDLMDLPARIGVSRFFAVHDLRQCRCLFA